MATCLKYQHFRIFIFVVIDQQVTILRPGIAFPGLESARWVLNGHSLYVKKTEKGDEHFIKQIPRLYCVECGLDCPNYFTFFAITFLSIFCSLSASCCSHCTTTF